MEQTDADWQAWYDRHGPALLLYARQVTRSLAEAEDAMHDGFIRFWKHREHAEDALAYLYRAVRTAALDLRRGESRRQQREWALADQPRPGSTEPWQDVAKDESEQQLRDAIASLPKPQRELLVMKVWGGLTFDQIAHAAGLPRSTAAARYQSGIKALRETMAEKERL